MTRQPQAAQRPNILVIEDFPSWQKNFKRLLRHEPFNLLMAANHREALRLARTHLIDLMILDVNLSGVPYNVDGLRLAEQVTRWQRNMKIIIVSGSREWVRLLKAYQFEPAFIIEKQSLDQDDLIAKIYQSLGRHHSFASENWGGSA